MTGSRNTLVNFVARGTAPDEWRLVLVEAGPWQEPLEGHLRLLQERLIGCVDAALDGQLAQQFPETHGARVIVQVDGYNLPEADVRAFFHAFAEGIFEVTGYRDALEQTPFVRGVAFEISFDHIH